MLRTALRLGVTAFGGPIAHLGYFERTYVTQLGWLSHAEYAELIAVCQMLPGPTSSQVGFLIGLKRAGLAGALAAWLGFTLPAALALYACARLAPRLEGPLPLALLHGLKLTAVAVVAQALLSMARSLCPDAPRALLALLIAALLLVLGGTVGAVALQLAALALGAAAGVVWCRGRLAAAPATTALVPRRLAWLALALFALLLVALPFGARAAPHGLPALAALFYRSGALVFGGGHVVLPLLADALVPPGWLGADDFLTGYGLAQAVPGPLFSVAAYFGAHAWPPAPALGAAVALVFMFLPGLLLAPAGAALIGGLTRHAAARAALAGVNAAVVGVLAAALYRPVWITAVGGAADIVLVVAAFAGLALLRAPPLAAVLVCTVGSALRVALGG